MVVEYYLQFHSIRPEKCTHLHTEKSFRNLVNPNHILIVITLFRWIQHQSEFRLVLNLSEKCNYNPNLGCINKILKRLCVRNILLTKYISEKCYLLLNALNTIAYIMLKFLYYRVSY